MSPWSQGRPRPGPWRTLSYPSENLDRSIFILLRAPSLSWNSLPFVGEGVEGRRNLVALVMAGWAYRSARLDVRPQDHQLAAAYIPAGDVRHSVIFRSTWAAGSNCRESRKPPISTAFRLSEHIPDYSPRRPSRPPPRRRRCTNQQHKENRRAGGLNGSASSSSLGCHS